MPNPLLDNSNNPDSVSLYEAFISATLAFRSITDDEEYMDKVASMKNLEKVLVKLISDTAKFAQASMEIRKGRELTTEEKMLINDASSLIPEINRFLNIPLEDLQ